MQQHVSRLWRHFLTDTLFRNSIYLMMSTGVLAVFGFVFWLINARLFNASEVGLATTLISTMNLIALLSLVGFDTVLVRFLSRSQDRNEQINTALVLVGLAATVIAAGFVLFLPQISPKLVFVRQSAWLTAAFILFSVTAAWNVLTDAVFLAYRRTVFTLVINVLFCVVKIILPFAFMRAGAGGMFAAAGAASFVGFVLSILAMRRWFDFRPRLQISRRVLQEVRKYSLATYVSGMLNLLPPTILPIIITNRLGPDQSAYFYVVFMIATLLYTVSYATSRSLFAEGSHDENRLKESTAHAMRLTMAITVPAIAVVLLGGRLLLTIFGKTYADQGTELLQLMALSALAVCINAIYGSIFKVRRNLKAILIINTGYATVILGASIMLIHRGLVGVGFGWLIGVTATTALNIFFDKTETAKQARTVSVAAARN